jgi:hypothetical protein
MLPENAQHRSPTVRKPAANTGRRAFANGELPGGQFGAPGVVLIIGCTPVFFKAGGSLPASCSALVELRKAITSPWDSRMGAAVFHALLDEQEFSATGPYSPTI